MSNKVKIFGIIAITAVIVFTMAACNKGGGKTSGSDASSSAPAASSVLSSNTIDNFLKDYEKFVDDYVSLMQKAMDGDFTALTELEKYGALFEDWENKLEGYSESDFSPAQRRKMTELTDRLTNINF